MATITEHPATTEKTQYEFTKTEAASSRDFEVKDSSGELVFKTSQVDTHKLKARSFDLYDKDGTKLIRCEFIDISAYNIERYDKPKFEGQQPTTKPSLNHLPKLVHRDDDNVLYMMHKIRSNDIHTEWKVAGDVGDPTVLTVKEIAKKSYESYNPDKPDEVLGSWHAPTNGGSHNFELDMQAGADPALHVIMVVITNMVK